MYRGTLLLETQDATLFANTKEGDVVVKTERTDQSIHISPNMQASSNAIVSINASSVNITRDIHMYGSRIYTDAPSKCLYIGSTLVSDNDFWCQDLSCSNAMIKRIKTPYWDFVTNDISKFQLNHISPHLNALTIKNNGRIGINTDTPSNTLDVHGSGHFSDNVVIDNNIYIDGTLYNKGYPWTITGNPGVDYNASNLFVYQCLLVGKGTRSKDDSTQLEFSNKTTSRKIVLYDPVPSAPDMYNHFGLGVTTSTSTAQPNLALVYTTPSNSSHIFATAQGNNSYKEAMCILPEGCIAINQPVANQPTHYKLDVNGNAIISSNLDVDHVVSSNVTSCNINAESLCTSVNFLNQGPTTLDGATTINSNLAVNADISILGSASIQESIRTESDMYVRSSHFVYGRDEDPIYNNITASNMLVNSSLHVIDTVHHDAHTFTACNHYIGNDLFVSSNVTILNSMEVVGNTCIRGKTTIAQDIVVAGDIYFQTDHKVQGGPNYDIDNLYVKSNAHFKSNITVDNSIEIGTNIYSMRKLVMYSNANNTNSEFTGFGVTPSELAYSSECDHAFYSSIKGEIARFTAYGHFGLGTDTPRLPLHVACGAAAFDNEVNIGTSSSKNFTSMKAQLNISADLANDRISSGAFAFGQQGNAQVLIGPASIRDRHLALGYTMQYDAGVIQSTTTQGTPNPIFLNPHGGSVAVATTNIDAAHEALRIDANQTEILLDPESYTAEGTSDPSSDALNAFDMSASSGWLSQGTMLQYLTIKYKNKKLVTRYTMRPYPDDYNMSPTSWQFCGSDDKQSWQVLDSQTGIAWQHAFQSRTFDIQPQSTSFYFYQFIFIVGQDATKQIGVGKVMLLTVEPYTLTHDCRLGIATAQPSERLHIHNGSVFLDYEPALDTVVFRPQHGLYFNNKNYGVEVQIDPVTKATNTTLITGPNNSGILLKRATTPYDPTDSGRTLLAFDKNNNCCIGNGGTEAIFTMDMHGTFNLDGRMIKMVDQSPLIPIILREPIVNASLDKVYRIDQGADTVMTYLKNPTNRNDKCFFYMPDYGTIYSILDVDSPNQEFAITNFETAEEFPLSLLGQPLAVMFFNISFTISKDNNVGINYTDPKVPLHVMGDQYISDKLSIGTDKFAVVNAATGNLQVGYDHNHTPVAQLQLNNAIPNQRKQLSLYELEPTPNNHQYSGIGYSNTQLTIHIPDASLSSWTFTAGTTSTSTSTYFQISPPADAVTTPLRLGVRTMAPSSTYSLDCCGNIRAFTSTPTAQAFIAVQNTPNSAYGLKTDANNGFYIGTINPATQSQGPYMYFTNRKQTHGDLFINTPPATNLANLHITADRTTSMILDQQTPSSDTRRIAFSRDYDAQQASWFNTISSQHVDTFSTIATPAPLAIQPSTDPNATVTIGGYNARGYKLYVQGKTFSYDGFHQGSDINIKDNLSKIDNALDKLARITGYTYNLKHDNGRRRQAGLVAQEVEQVLPEAVDTDPATGLKSIAYNNVLALIVEAIKDIKNILTNNKHDAV